VLAVRCFVTRAVSAPRRTARGARGARGVCGAVFRDTETSLVIAAMQALGTTCTTQGGVLPLSDMTACRHGGQLVHYDNR